MLARSIATAAALAAAGAPACTQAEVSSVGPQAVSSVAPAGTSGPYVAGGTIVSVRLDQPLDSYTSAPGSSFTATLVNPMLDAQGRAIVAPGARVHGTFLSYGSPDDPRVVLRIDTIDTPAGALPLTAAVRQAQHVDLVAPSRHLAPRFESDFPRGSVEYGTVDAQRPPESELPGVTFAREPVREVHVPRGALMELQLTQPLVLPEGRAERQPRR